MARNRKRYYIARKNGPLNQWDVLRMRTAPEAAVFAYSHAIVVGPFRTSTAALLAADFQGSVTVKAAERMVGAYRPIAA